MSTRKPRVRSPHPGVVFIKPDATRTYYRARYVDPDTGKAVKVKLDPLALPSATTRTDWAITKSKSIAKRRTALDSGAVRTTGTAFADAIGRYTKAHAHLRDATKVANLAVTKSLIDWAASAGVRSADDLTRPKLIAFVESVINARRTTPATTKAKGKRGTRKASGKPKSAHTINRQLVRAKTILSYVCDLDLFPKLTHDDLRRTIHPIQTTSDRIDYLKPGQLQKLLEAALRHDAETQTFTREEAAGRRPKGTTPKYEPIAPFVATVMLTGMRYAEALALDWKRVELEAPDNDGKPVGEIYLAGIGTKTKRGRVIDLAVSPALKRLFTALKLRTGGKGPVFQQRERDEHGDPKALTRGLADAAAKHLRGIVKVKGRGKHAEAKDGFGAPDNFGWQALRRTCGTFLTNAPGIFGASSAYRSAKQLGHSVTVAERHYLDVARGIPRDAATLEAAMQIEAQIEAVIESVTGTTATAHAPVKRAHGKLKAVR